VELDFEKSIVEIEAQLAELTKTPAGAAADPGAQAAALRQQLEETKKKVYAELTPWQTVQVARHPERPVFADYVTGMFGEFVELHGDRCFGDDPALRGGFATIGEHRVMLIGTEKGKTVEDRVKRNFGMANPEGYRKALRLMRLAEKYGIPVVSLVDTPAAYPGLEAEQRGQAEAIARNLTEMAMLRTPLVSVITGEGGSGGALGVAAGDVVLMLAHAIYSVIPPEGCAAILWRTADKAPEAAKALRITAPELLALEIIDEIVPEPPGGAHRNHDAIFEATRKAILKHLDRLTRMSVKKLLDKRFAKYARIGKFDSRRRSRH